VASLRACADDALRSDWGYAWRHAGEVGDPRSVTTVCLAVVREGEVVLGVAAAPAQDVTPARAWPGLGPWRLHDPPANVAALQRWSRAQASDRTRVPRPAQAQAPALDGEGLLRQVLEAPDDDRPRRVYADWLLERGDPRGDFIALQLASAERPEGPSEFEPRAAALLAEHRAAWLGPLAMGAARFERGFLEVLSLGPGRAPLLGPLLDREPLHTLVAEGGEAALQAAASPWLGRVRGLEVVRGPGVLRARELATLLESTFLGGLQRLSLAGHPLGDEGAALLASRGHAALRRLEALALLQSEVGARGFEALCQSPLLRRLTSLTVAGSALTPAGVAALAASSGKLRLARLRLDRVGAGDAGARALASAPGLGGLQALSLQGNQLGPAGAAALLESATLKGLRWLDLSANPVGAKAERALAARFGPASPGPRAPW
jgi:uncharacterized protein (TIGR02996 family)